MSRRPSHELVEAQAIVEGLRQANVNGSPFGGLQRVDEMLDRLQAIHRHLLQQLEEPTENHKGYN